MSVDVGILARLPSKNYKYWPEYLHRRFAIVRVLSSPPWQGSIDCWSGALQSGSHGCFEAGFEYGNRIWGFSEA